MSSADALVLFATALLPACATTVPIEPYLIAPVPGPADPPLDVGTVVRGAARASFVIVGGVDDRIVLRRGNARRYVEVTARRTPFGLELAYHRSRGFRARQGRVHKRYYVLIDELVTAIRVEQYAVVYSLGGYVPVDMQASMTRAEITPTGSVTTTRVARVSTLAPAGQARYSVSAEGPPTAAASDTVPATPSLEDKSP